MADDQPPPSPQRVGVGQDVPLEVSDSFIDLNKNSFLECDICSEPITDPSLFITEEGEEDGENRCFHTFHYGRYCSQMKECPICRRKVLQVVRNTALAKVIQEMMKVRRDYKDQLAQKDMRLKTLELEKTQAANEAQSQRRRNDDLKYRLDQSLERHKELEAKEKRAIFSNSKLETQVQVLEERVKKSQLGAAQSSDQIIAMKSQLDNQIKIAQLMKESKEKYEFQNLELGVQVKKMEEELEDSRNVIGDLRRELSDSKSLVGEEQQKGILLEKKLRKAQEHAQNSLLVGQMKEFSQRLLGDLTNIPPQKDVISEDFVNWIELFLPPPPSASGSWQGWISGSSSNFSPGVKHECYFKKEVRQKGDIRKSCSIVQNDESRYRTEYCKKTIMMGTSHPRARTPLSIFREAFLLDKLVHPHIVHFSGVDGTRTEVCLYLELGSYSLEYMLKSPGSLNIPLSLGYFKQIISAVAYLHRHEVVHRAISSFSVLYQSKSMKLSCFRHSRSLRSLSLTNTYPNLSTEYLNRYFQKEQRFFAPELFYFGDQTIPGHVWLAADVWSVGCLFAEMILRCLFDKQEQERAQHPRQTKSAPNMSTGFSTVGPLLTSVELFEEKERGSSLDLLKSILSFKDLRPPKESILDCFPILFQCLDESEAVRSLETQFGFLRVFSLAQKMLRFFPFDRVTAQKALDDPFWDSVQIGGYEMGSRQKDPAHLADPHVLPFCQERIYSAK